ncbi:MAG TPA: hypothetical protein VF618_11675 [Thermoanaerobaculia bacterium]
MRIRFRGLIAHLRVTGEDGNELDIAVLAYHQNHYPKLMVPFESALNRRSRRDRSDDTPLCIDLRKTLTRTSRGVGIARFRDLDDVIPLLDPAVKPEPSPPYPFHTAIKNRRDFDSGDIAHAIVELPPGGRYHVVEHYNEHADFGSGRQFCTARTVEYAVRTDDNESITFQMLTPDGGATVHTIDITGTSEIYFSNLCPADCPKDGDDFKAYERLFDPPVVATPPRKGDICEAPKTIDKPVACATPPDDDIDCANSRLP